MLDENCSVVTLPLPLLLLHACSYSISCLIRLQTITVIKPQPNSCIIICPGAPRHREAGD